MQTFTALSKCLLTLSIVGLLLGSCKKKEVEVIKEVVVKETVTEPAFRSSFDASRLTANTPYDSLFIDGDGVKTVDLTEGNNRLKMFQDLLAYSGTSNSGTTKLDSNVLRDRFRGSSFSNSSLNGLGIQLRNVTGLSSTNPEKVRRTIEGFFAGLDVASIAIADTAKEGKAGKVFTKPNTAGNVSKYLLDANGLELNQLIQKGLMGAYQYDYIANVLMSDAKLGADNHHLVPGKKYTELEHNWDEAFANFTLNKVYAKGATIKTITGESYLARYAWEYGDKSDTTNADFKKLHLAFLKGRAAIVNNNLTEVKAQALFIKTVLEKVIARAGFNYISKWKASRTSDPNAGFHQLAEGLGFVYSLRFCTVHGANDAFADDLLNKLVYGNTNGVWTLNTENADYAINAIKAKFNVQ